MRTIEIEASAETLWPLLTEPANLRLWNPDIVDEEIEPDVEPGVGAKSVVHIEEGSRVVKYDSEVLTWEPPHRLGIVLRGGSLGEGPMYVDYTVAERDGGVVLTYSATWQPLGIVLRILAPIFAVVGRKHAAQALGRLKSLAEDGTPG